MKYYCPYCGIRIKRSRTRCPRCYQRFRTVRSAKKPAKEPDHPPEKMFFPEPASDHRFRLVVLGIFFLVLFLMLLYFMANMLTFFPFCRWLRH